jgi:hypothetical protein
MTLRNRIEKLERADEPSGSNAPMAGFAAYMRTAEGRRRRGEVPPPTPTGRPWARRLRDISRRMQQRAAQRATEDLL